MRTLIVYGNSQALHHALARVHPDVHANQTTTRQAVTPWAYTVQSLSNPADVVQGVVIDGPQDLQRLRGLCADVVIEDHSFELYDHRWDSALIADTMAGFRGQDVYELWAQFLRVYVLR